RPPATDHRGRCGDGGRDADLEWGGPREEECPRHPRRGLAPTEGRGSPDADHFTAPNPFRDVGDGPIFSAKRYGREMTCPRPLTPTSPPAGGGRRASGRRHPSRSSPCSTGWG